MYLKGRLADVAPADYSRVNPCLFCLAFLWLSLTELEGETLEVDGVGVGSLY